MCEYYIITYILTTNTENIYYLCNVTQRNRIFTYLILLHNILRLYYYIIYYTYIITYYQWINILQRFTKYNVISNIMFIILIIIIRYIYLNIIALFKVIYLVR